MTIEQALDASKLHQQGQKIEADRYFRYVNELNDHCYNAMKAWINANYAYLKLDQNKKLLIGF